MVEKGLDVVVMPSLSEACPLLAIETLLSGTPLIAFDCIGLRCTLKNTTATVVPMGNSKALAEAILKEMDSSTRDKVLDNRDYLLKRFDIKRVAAEIETLYQKLINNT